MKEAGDVLRNLGVPETQVKRLRRWDRIAMIREMSSRASAWGMLTSLNKFAHGDHRSLSIQQVRKKCDNMYQRQMDVLGSTRTSFSSDEGNQTMPTRWMSGEKVL